MSGSVLLWCSMSTYTNASHPSSGAVNSRSECRHFSASSTKLPGTGVSRPRSSRGGLPALEFVDSRVAGEAIALADIVADNAFAGAVALGSRPAGVFELDLSLTGGLLRRGGAIVGTGAGGAVLGSPVNALVWLAAALGPRGAALEAGHVILPGSVCAAVPSGPGDTVSATFDRIGTVSITFTGQ
jgi:2-keto-4-pentenoate hydratase